MELLTLLAIIIVIETSYLTIKSFGLRRLSRKKIEGATFVDTSVLIDGRIVFAMETGFVPDLLCIPSSVTRELQLLADGADHDKRTRARHGLDMIHQLQEISPKQVVVFDDGKFENGVDEQLIALAKKFNGKIMTIDYNLNKVAIAESISVLNINELAQQIRVNYLPGERLSVELLQKGSDSHQAVGYLDDGTMVVVERASKDIGKTVEIELIRNLQTAAGRMMFAKKITPDSPAKPKPTQSSKKRSTGRDKQTASSRKTSKSREDDFLSLIDKQ